VLEDADSQMIIVIGKIKHVKYAFGDAPVCVLF
jgi:hypothetical protein